MTTNRQQHELAAKAAGLTLTWKTGSCKGGEFEAAFVGDQPWQPKEDDGASQRLMVKLNMTVVINSQQALTLAGQQNKSFFPTAVEHKGFPEIATRLAIFNVAVEIGKAMP